MHFGPQQHPSLSINVKDFSLKNEYGYGFLIRVFLLENNLLTSLG